MSQFLGTTGGSDGGIPFRSNDIRLMPEYIIFDLNYEITSDNPWSGKGYSSGRWPGNSGLMTSGNEWLGPPVWQDFPEITSGAVAAMGFSGITRDAYGSPLGGCTVKLFKTADGGYPGYKDRLVYEATSDVNGLFYLYSAYFPDTHYIVSTKAGSPDVMGVTVNTLVGA